MAEADGNPKLFISYSWTSPEHQQWVIDFATNLRECGIDVILDKWDLREGHDAYAFMEKMVTDPEIKKVVLICDRNYAEKSDERRGGVGTETQIISPQIYAKADQDKFVAVVRERDDSDEPYLPTYYNSRIYIDLSDEDLFSTNFEQLLRWIYDKPLYIKPDLGKKPAFLNDAPESSLGTSVAFRRALDAIKNDKNYSSGALTEYFDILIQNLEQLRLTSDDEKFDDKVVESIDQFLPYRNEAIEIFLAVAQYKNTRETHQQLHRFIEGLIPYRYPPENIGSYREWDFDNFLFIVHELFLYLIASLIKYECFDGASYLMRHHYYFPNNRIYKNNMIPFSDIYHFMESLDYRNKQLNPGRLSIRADMLKNRCNLSNIPFLQLMQADFVLYIRDCLNVIREKNKYQHWWPDTLVYHSRGGVFEIFARSQSGEYFERIKCLFDIESKTDFDPLMEAYRQEQLRIPRWDHFHTFSPDVLMGKEQLATKP